MRRFWSILHLEYHVVIESDYIYIKLEKRCPTCRCVMGYWVIYSLYRKGWEMRRLHSKIFEGDLTQVSMDTREIERHLFIEGWVLGSCSLFIYQLITLVCVCVYIYMYTYTCMGFYWLYGVSSNASFSRILLWMTEVKYSSIVISYYEIFFYSSDQYIGMYNIHIYICIYILIVWFNSIFVNAE